MGKHGNSTAVTLQGNENESNRCFHLSNNSPTELLKCVSLYSQGYKLFLMWHAIAQGLEKKRMSADSWEGQVKKREHWMMAWPNVKHVPDMFSDHTQLVGFGKKACDCGQMSCGHPWESWFKYYIFSERLSNILFFVQQNPLIKWFCMPVGYSFACWPRNKPELLRGQEETCISNTYTQHTYGKWILSKCYEAYDVKPIHK